TSCPICDPLIETDSNFYHDLVELVTGYDPRLTISGYNQNTILTFADLRTRSIYQFRSLLETLTYWKIPISFRLFTNSIVGSEDTTVGEVSELTEELEDSYKDEVENFLLQRPSIESFAAQFPVTPVPQQFSALQHALDQGSILRRQVQSLVKFVRTQDSSDQSDIESPLKNKGKAVARNQSSDELSNNAAELSDNAESIVTQFDQQINTPPADDQSNNNKVNKDSVTLDAKFFEPELDKSDTDTEQNQASDHSVTEAEQDQPTESSESERADSDTESEDDQNLLVPINPPQVRIMARNANYPVFDGTRPEAWARAMDIAFAANQVNNEPIKINTAAAHLGEYVDWYSNQPAFTHWTGGNVGNNDRNMKDIFLAHFKGPEEKAEALNQMWKRRQRRNENITSYANALERIWSATEVNIPDAIKLSQFIGGLEPTIQPLVKAQNPQNIADAIAAAKRVATGSTHATYLTQEEENPMVTGLIKQLAELNKQMAELKEETAGNNAEQTIQQKRFNRNWTHEERLLDKAKEKYLILGKRERTPLKGKGASLLPIRPSNAAQQYGASDDSGPLCCKAIVQGEEAVALVDTGSALTLISKALYDRIVHKLVNPKIEESSVNIMGIAGLRKRCEGRIKDIPIKFKKKEWKLTAEIIHHPSVDIILGQNFLTEVKAKISLPDLQMTLGDGIERELIRLYREKSGKVNLCLMTKYNNKKNKDLKPWRRPKKPIPKSKWKCREGPKEQTCINKRAYDDDPIPCSKCANKYWEKEDYDYNKQKYSDFKMEYHSDGWRAVYECRMTKGDLAANIYDLWVKGSELKMNGEVVVGGKALGHIGLSWTKYHPEAEPKQPREKEPGYEWRSNQWYREFVGEPEGETNQLDVESEIENIEQGQMEVDESIFYIDCSNVQNFKHQKTVPIQENEHGIIIDGDQWTWHEIQRVQARFTREARSNQLPYHWKGPDSQCWHRDYLGVNEICDSCIIDLQAMTILSKVGDSQLTRWENEKKIKPRKRLLPVEQRPARFPAKWQTFKNIQARRWKDSATMPKEKGEDYILIASEDITIKGLGQVRTDIEIQVLPDRTLLLTPLEGENRFIMQAQALTQKHRISITIITDERTVIRKGSEIARLITLPGLLKPPLQVLAGQKVENRPAPVVQDLTPEQQKQIDLLLKEFESVFSKDLNDLGHATIIQHKIDTGDAKPYQQVKNRSTWCNQEFIEKEVERMLQAGIIERLNIDDPSTLARSNAWVSPVVIVQKKNGSQRFCVDYRALNAVTVPNRHPFPVMEDVIADIAKSGKQPQIFSALDLASGYWQVEMEEESKLKTAFSCHKGLFYYNRLPFGLKNAPVSFQSMMEMIFAKEIGDHLAVYIDDINIYSTDFDQHLTHLRGVLEKAKKYGLKLKREKCKFACEELEFLGHVIGKEGLAPDDRKIEAIKDYPAPVDTKEIQSFLGMTGFYRQFIQDYSELTKPITDLLKKKIKFLWTDECQDAFETLKRCLIKSPILVLPNKIGMFTLMTDASDFALGAVLSQDHAGTDYVIAYISKKLNPTEQRYHVNEKEGMAVTWAIHKKCRRYLHG
ncbi:3066_t:CDS:2, partial [Paraglomus occultum]